MKVNWNYDNDMCCFYRRWVCSKSDKSYGFDNFKKCLLNVCLQSAQLILSSGRPPWKAFAVARLDSVYVVIINY